MPGGPIIIPIQPGVPGFIGPGVIVGPGGIFVSEQGVNFMANIGQMDLGFPAIVFNRATGGSGDSFSLPSGSGRYSKLLLQAIGRIGAAPGTITALVINLEVSLDGGVTWNVLGTGVTLTTLAVAIDVAGLGNGVWFRITSTTFTLGTATSIVIFANAG